CSSFVWTSDPTSWAPPIVAYAIVPLSPFPYLPWAGYLFAGVAVGGLVMRTENKERLARWLLAIGVLLPTGIFILKWMPIASPYDATWWKTSPGMHVFRICGTLTLLALLMLFEPRLRESRLGARLQLIGNESLFMYLSHLTIVYGAVGASLRDMLGIANSGYLTIVIAWVVVTVPLLFLMQWWHNFKRERPERARDILALQVIVFITYFLIAPQSHTFD
ncbi:MAG: DUF418 domain-containing protein, partial [Candidatus Kapabacteria bacterium]|nr:DUF418 domain-containing protein [Candidatus Kapabacteria bacterium]